MAARTPVTKYDKDTRHLRRVRAVILASMAGVVAGAGPAQPTFHDAVEAAWARYPERAGIAAQQVAAGARAEAARSAFPDSPTLSGIYADDHLIGSNEGYTTYEAELSTPIWLPGEGAATERAANADARAYAAQSSNAHLTVAADVLDAAAEALLAQEQVATANSRLKVTRQVARDVDHAARVGEIAAADADAARAQMENDTALAADAQVRAAMASAALESLTGSKIVPLLVTGLALPSEDPRIASAERRLDAANAALRLVRASPIADPEVGLEGIREKQFGSPWDSRVGITFRIPLPSRARNLPRLAVAESNVTAAQAELLRVRRLVQLGIVQAHAQFGGARARQAASVRAAADLDRRAGAVSRAWRLGEMPLIELLRAQAAAFDADAERNRADVTLQAAALRAVLATGTIP